MSNSSAFKPTRSQLARLQAEWSRMAGEPVAVTRIGALYVATGSELAVLRLKHRYPSPRARAVYSRNLANWAFLLDGRDMSVSHVNILGELEVPPIVVAPDQVTHGSMICIQSCDGEIWVRTPGVTAEDHSHAQLLAHAYNWHAPLVRALEASIAALPDAWFAHRNGLPLELIEKLDAVLLGAKT